MTAKFLSIWDYVVIAASLLLSIGIGVYHALTGGKQKTTSEFMVGNRNLKVIPVALSLIVSYESSIMMIGFPGEIYVYGLQYCFTNIGYTIAAFLIALFVVPLYCELKVVSVFEYIEARFESRAVRLLGCFVGMMSTVMYMGIVLYGPATALEAITGFPTWSSIIVLSAAAVVYTSLGGIKAVVWADAFQSVMMLTGLLILVIVGIVTVGGVGEVWKLSLEGGRLNTPSLSFNPTIRVSLWASAFGMTLSNLELAISQTVIQRVASMPSKQAARKIVLALIPGSIFFTSLATLTGLVAYAHYRQSGCDPLLSGAVSNPNQIVPYFMLELLSGYPGLSGIFLAGLFSASLSTLSSGYTSLATLTWTDFLHPLLPNMPDRTATIISRCIVVVMGALVTGVAFIMMNVSATMTQMAGDFIHAFSGPSVGLFLMAAFIPIVNNKGVIIGCLVGSSVIAWKGYGASFSLHAQSTSQLPLVSDACNFTISNYTTTVAPNYTALNVSSTATDFFESPLNNFYAISHLWNSALGAIVTIVTAVIISYLTGARDPKTVDPKLLIPVKEIVCSCFRRRRDPGNDFTETKFELELHQMPEKGVLLEKGDNSIRIRKGGNVTSNEESEVE